MYSALLLLPISLVMSSLLPLGDEWGSADVPGISDNVDVPLDDPLGFFSLDGQPIEEQLIEGEPILSYDDFNSQISSSFVPNEGAVAHDSPCPQLDFALCSSADPKNISYRKNLNSYSLIQAQRIDDSDTSGSQCPTKIYCCRTFFSNTSSFSGDAGDSTNVDANVGTGLYCVRSLTSSSEAFPLIGSNDELLFEEFYPEETA